MLLALAVFSIGALDAFGYYRVEALQGLLNIPSLMVIIGGSFFQALAAFPATAVGAAVAKLKPTFTARSTRDIEEALLDNVLEMARGLRNDRSQTIAQLTAESKGFRLYLAELLSTNYGVEEIRVLGGHKIHTMKQAEMNEMRVITLLGASSPAYGMLGTLMGLIVMLSNFENARGLASGLALALMTTFYGLLMTQFVWQPLSKKMLNGVLLNEITREIELEAVLLTLERKPELFVIDQLSSMLQSREGASNVNP